MSPKKTVALGQYVKVPSERNPLLHYRVYTGDEVNGPHCTCESFRYLSRTPGVLATCKHIRRALRGEGAS